MCGIFGMLEVIEEKPVFNLRLKSPKRGILTDGIQVAMLRGYDSTGLAIVGGKDVTVVKKALSAHDFVQTRIYEKALHGLDKKWAIIGHARSATRGNVTDENSHPFRVGRITLVHNGTLTNYEHTMLDGKSFNTDSESITNMIDKKGIQATVDAMDGAYALVWHDKVKGTVNFLRNKERPLFFAKSEDEKMLFFASEHQMISLAAERHGVSLGKLYVFNENTQFIFKEGSLKYTTKKVEPAKKVVSSLIALPNLRNRTVSTSYIKTLGASVPSADIKIGDIINVKKFDGTSYGYVDKVGVIHTVVLNKKSFIPTEDNFQAYVDSAYTANTTTGSFILCCPLVNKKEDLPKTEPCSYCGEQVVDNKFVIMDGLICCDKCQDYSYHSYVGSNG
jgi:predicted glutamine amidotransferase